MEALKLLSFNHVVALCYSYSGKEPIVDTTEIKSSIHKMLGRSPIFYVHKATLILENGHVSMAENALAKHKWFKFDTATNSWYNRHIDWSDDLYMFKEGILTIKEGEIDAIEQFLMSCANVKVKREEDRIYISCQDKSQLLFCKLPHNNGLQILAVKPNATSDLFGSAE